jgi:hypothetical protein
VIAEELEIFLELCYQPVRAVQKIRSVYLMFKRIHFFLFIALILSCKLVCADSIMNKCTDGREITYTDKPCEKLGLTSAGPMNYSVTIVPATPVPQAPRNKGKEKNIPEPEVPVSSAVESEAYKCTTYYGVISYSSSPCPASSYVVQLRSNRPVQQQAISRKAACENISANPEASSGNSVLCP